LFNVNNLIFKLFRVTEQSQLEGVKLVRTILNLEHEIFKKRPLLTENINGEISSIEKQHINLKEHLINNNIEKISKQIS